MRLKTLPADFRVREMLEFERDPRGAHFVHRLTKSKVDTQEALAIVAERARVDRAAIAFAGLKDRQGVTEQWISIEGARADFRARGVQCRYVGRSAEPITSKQSYGNEFRIVVRDLAAGAARRLAEHAERAGRFGYANYFDDQRFGSLRHGQGLVMKDVLRGRHEAALKGLIARPSEKAITGDVKLKRLLHRFWGEWDKCRGIARGPVWQRLFRHLEAHPDDFTEALALLPARQKLIHAYAYQSFLWNRSIDLLLKRELPAYRRLAVRTVAGTYVSWRKTPAQTAERLRELETPLYGPGGDGGSKAYAAAVRQVLRDAGLAAEDFEANRIPGMVLREEPRELVVQPRDLQVSLPEPDEEFRGRRKVTLEFGLPRGAYATMLVKHLTADELLIRDHRSRGHRGAHHGARRGPPRN